MQPERLFRLAALAWLVTAAVRILLALVDAGQSRSGGSPVLFGIGAALGIGVALLLLRAPGRGSAWAATALGFYAVAGLLYLPLIGFQPWFVVLAVTGLLAFVLSVLCVLATRRHGPSPDA